MFEKRLAEFFGVSDEYLRGETDDHDDGIEMHVHRDPSIRGMPLDEALSLVNQLERLALLHNEGKLTYEEFARLKKKSSENPHHKN